MGKNSKIIKSQKVKGPKLMGAKWVFEGRRAKWEQVAMICELREIKAGMMNLGDTQN